ncbi:MAG: hypothetical protein KKE82_05100, partial [Proteobacteria bacterium]|nr:hypothetical protein [Pseudomonadota bacterium]
VNIFFTPDKTFNNKIREHRDEKCMKGDKSAPDRGVREGGGTEVQKTERYNKKIGHPKIEFGINVFIDEQKREASKQDHTQRVWV